MSAVDAKLRTEESRATFAGRIDILYSLGRHYLSLPFAVLCIPVTLFGTRPLGWLPLMPLCLQIAVVIAAEQLNTAYKQRETKRDPMYWARRYTFVSAIAGATWGVATLFWFVPNSYPAQAYLALAFLGMTATEFIARSAYRPAYLAHAGFALTPLVFLLLRQGGTYATMTAVLIVLFTAVLYTYCGGIWVLDGRVPPSPRRKHRSHREAVATKSTKRNRRATRRLPARRPNRCSSPISATNCARR